MSLLAIPPELIETIFHWLDASNTLKLAQVSRQFWRIYQQSSALRYRTHLELAGLRDGQGGNFGSAARLDILRTYQAAWANFDWSQSTKTAVQMSGNLWELVGNVLATHSPEAGFLFTRIPSPLRQVPHEEWSITDLSFGVNDFSMDFSMDLLLVVQVDSLTSIVVHLLSLRTGRPHPLARQPQLSVQVDPLMPSLAYSFQIRIFGEFIGVMTEPEDGDPELHVWEWKSGLLKRHIDDHITSFAFLDDRRLLTSGFVDHRAELKVSEINEAATEAASFSFLLPDLRLDPWEVDISIQTEPPPSWPANTQLSEPFTTSHADRLFVVSLRGWGRAVEPAFLLCVQLSTFIKIMEKSTTSTGRHRILWERWGPSNTRMLRVPIVPDSWVCYVYGQRCVIQTDETQWKILDFNQFNLNPKCRIEHDKTVDQRRRMFVEAVTTSAPFTLHSVSIPPSIRGVMLAEDAIVTVSLEEEVLSIFSI
ncbi:hypothetical protein C8R46DRAFT_1072889 [Mycena filopes]|nr:hypothetical protein C8R46DRAFT_1072889 [Mycena filopes]